MNVLLNECQQQESNYSQFIWIIGEKVRYQKTSEGDFKRLEKNSSIDLVMQKFHCQSKEDKDIKFLAITHTSLFAKCKGNRFISQLIQSWRNTFSDNSPLQYQNLLPLEKWLCETILKSNIIFEYFNNDK